MKFKKKQEQIQSQNTKERLPFLTWIVNKLCPCFNKSKKRIKYQIHEQTKTQVDKERSSKEVLMLEPKKEQIISREEQNKVEQKVKKAQLFLSLQERIQNNNDINKMRNSGQVKWMNYPVNSLKEKEIILIGKPKAKLLCILTTVSLGPSDYSRKLAKKSKTTEKVPTKNTHLYLDKYWDGRYFLFQKFDEGISIEDSFWPIIIPQAVSDHVCSKIRCETVLNLKCGIGGQAIKLANTCGRVIAMDQYEGSLKCLEVNSKIYCTQNLNICFEPQQFKKQLQPQIILISLYAKLQQECLNNPLTSLTKIKPGLDAVIKKAMGVSRNLVIILPANIDVNQLSSLISEQMIERNFQSQTCLIHLQKVFYRSQLKYLVAYFGSLLQTQATIDDELHFLYKKLGFDTKLAIAYRKIIKKLRQMFGMVKLLNIIVQLESKKEGITFNNLEEYIISNNLVDEQKIRKIFGEIKKTHSEEGAGKQNHQHQFNNGEFVDRTISSISIGTVINNRQSIQNRFNDLQYDPYKSAPLYRESNLRPHSTTHYEIPCQVNEEQESRQSFVAQYRKQRTRNWQQKQ